PETAGPIPAGPSPTGPIRARLVERPAPGTPDPVRRRGLAASRCSRSAPPGRVALQGPRGKIPERVA
ncbi:MAG: hypothetical protein MI919_00220, partial [Holophagales bacterium]|nr:hypothetical protein [Holophagales bacterium]